MLDAFKLNGKVAVVTGASRGIGRAVAESLADAGCAVALLARTTDDLKELSETIQRRGGQAWYGRVDVRDREQVEGVIADAISHFGKIDILVNNAGIQNVKPFLDYSEDEWESLIETNLEGVLRMTKVVGKHLVERRQGCVIDMGSIYGFVGAPGNAIYSLTKSGLGMFARTLATEWARYNVRVNTICPGWIETALTERYMKDEKVTSAALRQIPLRRFGTPADIGPLAVYLASEAASYVTGQFFVVDGGQTAR